MQLSDFDFEIPEEQIAFHPAPTRHESRLLVVNRKLHTIEHLRFSDFPRFLTPNDLLVLNNTKVIPARLLGKAGSSEIEVFLLSRPDPSHWERSEAISWRCLVKPGKKVREGLEVEFGEGVKALLTRAADDFFCEFKSISEENFHLWLERNGKIPLPTYIKRDPSESDQGTYQTVFAKHRGSVAAPTAGLHFTKEVLNKIKSQGTQIEEVTLHVGYGTFAPIKTENINDHRMHHEKYSAPADLIEKISSTRRRGGRAIAVGTTSLRTLESIPIHGTTGETNLFIKPGYELKNVDALLTNFHTPKSSLFVLVCSLLGVERAKEIYRVAVAEKYRFYSYGDAMLIL